MRTKEIRILKTTQRHPLPYCVDCWKFEARKATWIVIFYELRTMNLIDKNKSEFKKELDKFSEKLKKYVSTDNGDWTVKGFIDVYKNIYTMKLFKVDVIKLQ